ncbi:unnamed protein product [Mytilus coruscus]|uniref:Uncharacterized protein n=1 Tax=Mytilus coruscus TaxID=42192 RepID=A0A6J8BEC5_MYTCO|nr:unnamed protein product [Mytilus coruscus]
MCGKDSLNSLSGKVSPTNRIQNVPVHAERHDKLPLLTVPEILPCGHLCEVCRKNKDENVLVIDRSYSKSKAEADTSSEIQHASSSETPAKKDKPIFISSIPLKTDFQKCAVEPIFTPVNILDESFVESDSDNFENDISTCYTEEQKLIKENKFIVFESAIDTLINKLKCNICECPVDPDDIVKDLSNGTVITITAYCTSGHIVVKWSSQPFVGKMPVGNLLVSAATLFCGQTYSHISQFAEFCNLQYISHSTYNKIQRQCLMSVVQHTWSLLQEVELKKIKEQNRQIRLAGDERCDSPGFSAKYCTYSLLDIETQRIITFVVVKVTETGSSSKMEVEDSRRCMTLLLDMGFRIEVLATDRHVQIRSIMKKEFSEVQHQFDVWHLCKSIKKKLTLRAKGKGCEDLNHWMKSICNHLLWCASNCGGDKDILEESWISIVNHTVNIHSFESKFFKQCAHTQIEPEVSDTKKWLVKDSKAHKALKEVVFDKHLRKDIRQLNEFCHTENLEVFHSLLLKYTPKPQEFDNERVDTYCFGGN